MNLGVKNLCERLPSIHDSQRLQRSKNLHKSLGTKKLNSLHRKVESSTGYESKTASMKTTRAKDLVHVYACKWAMHLCMLGKPCIVIFCNSFTFKTPLMFTKAPSLPQHKLAKKRTTMASTQPNPKPPHQKQKSRTKKKHYQPWGQFPKRSNLVDPQTVRWVPFVLATTSRHVMGCGSSKCRRDRTYRVGEVWESCPRDLV